MKTMGELRWLEQTCDPSACDRATDGPARHCLRGAGQEPSACNWKTGGHDQCCLQVLPPVHELLGEPNVSGLLPRRNKGPVDRVQQGLCVHLHRIRAQGGTNGRSSPAHTHDRGGADDRWRRGSLGETVRRMLSSLVSSRQPHTCTGSRAPLCAAPPREAAATAGRPRDRTDLGSLWRRCRAR